MAGLEEDVAKANGEVKQAQEDKKTMTESFETMEKEKQLEGATSVYDAFRIAKESTGELLPKIQEAVRKLNTAAPQFKTKYQERLRKLQAEFQSVARGVDSEANSSMIQMTSIKSAGQSDALQKKAEEQKKIVFTYVEEIKPMVEGALSEAETKEAQESAKKKLE